MILLSAGHYPESPGACFGTFCEHAEAVEWVNRIAFYLRHQIAVQVIPTGPLSEKVRTINDIHRLTPAALAVEVHFNSAGGMGAGSETLYCPPLLSSQPNIGMMAARIVQDAMGTIMSPNRGIKEGWYRQDKPGHVDYPGDVDGNEKPDYFLMCAPIALILEPEFIHRRDLIESKREVATRTIADALAKAAIVVGMHGHAAAI